jgi:hypothetical protein
VLSRMTRKNRKKYVLREGMVLERVYHERVYRLLVIRQGDDLKFKVDEHVFASLTAAHPVVTLPCTSRIT